MGRLIGLELNNFKSYRGTTSIGLGSSFFTSIIGPNGAGKSNMMDAISFVLGVRSTHLRSQNLKDLIYRGRRSNSDSNSSVDELEQDPTRAYVMATYEKENGEIIKLKRTISATGNSEYRINDVSVTSLNYSMVLKAENILIKARNFLVFQGDVEQIASQSPKDLTKLIENISGSSEFAKEYDSLQEEYEKAREFSNSVFSRKRTLNSESKQYKEQMAEQRQFEEKLIEKDNAIKAINLYQIFHNEKKHFEIEKEVRSKTLELKELKKNLTTEEKLFKSASTIYSKKVLESKQHNKTITNVSTKIESLKRDLIPMQANKRAVTSKINSSKTKINDLQGDLKRQTQLVEFVEKQLRDAQRLFKDFQNSVASSVSMSISADGQREYEKLRADYLANGGSALEEEISLLMNEKDGLLASINSLENQKSNSHSRISDLQSAVNTDLKSKLADITSDINDLLALKQEKVDSRSALIKAKDQYKYEELQINSELRDVLVRLDEISSQQRESNKQKKLRENVSMLKGLFPQGAIKGIVYEMVRPTEQKYENALQTALARNMDSVIVETTNVAYKCIDILKERRAGVVTFIPLDSVLTEPINLNYMRTIHESAQPVIDILEYEDKSIEQAINYIVGDTLVVEGIDLARRLKWNSTQKLENKIVTLEGSIIHKSGLMTGGNQSQKSAAALSWDKNEWTNLNSLKEDISMKLSALHESKPKELEINLLAEEISQLDDRLPILRNQKLSIERTIKDRETEIAYQEELQKGFAQSISSKKTKIAKIEKKIANIHERTSALQKETYSDFCTKYGFSNGIDDYENMHGATLRVRVKERTQYSKAISTLSNKLKFEKERVEETKSREQILNDQLIVHEEKLSKVTEEIQTIEEKVDNLEAELEVLESEQKQFSIELSSQMKNSKALESKVAEYESTINSLTKQIVSLEEQLLKVDTERVNILKNCKIQNINIPLRDGLLESISIGENSDSLVKEIYEIEVDYSMLDERLKQSFNPRLQSELETKLQNTIEQLERLTPNGKAVDRLKEVESKLKDFDKDHTLARQKERKIYEKFQEVREKRYNAFMEAFNHISSQIDSTYKELTKFPASPLGGTAYLTLEDDEFPYNSGIKYHAMPPMKRFRDMDLLSGGEKTMAALALLFAIHSYQPSPFFVLDEVDAALDNANVSRIANYIRKYAGPNYQFIVISLKNSLFEKSDALVGIYREQRENSSRTVTLDLREYPDEPIPAVAASV
ncbi:structural maintenance of chromosome protein 1 [Scheffersomyces xylosifermentans]|uniref:structural maintenance of chromosome protein 1 n=1 Tax=Scheffersomyces xylosifermentans TaxID=1304137 RepID=UPI00315D9B53